MFAAAAPPSPSRRNLDYAFPPFAPGLPSVYERAGFGVNPHTVRSRSNSRASSLRKGSLGSTAGSGASLRSHGSFGGPIANPRDVSPGATPNSEYSQFDGGLQKPTAPLSEIRRPSSPLANEASLIKKPAQDANPYRTATPGALPALPTAVPAAVTSSASSIGQASGANPYRTEYPSRGPWEQSAPEESFPVDRTANLYEGSQASSPDQLMHSQTASNASTATSDFEFLDPKPVSSLPAKPTWAQAQDNTQRSYMQAQPETQQLYQSPMTESHYSSSGGPPGASRTLGGLREVPDVTPRTGGSSGLLSVPQPDLNRMSTTSSIYSNHALPLATQQAAQPLELESRGNDQNQLSESPRSSLMRRDDTESSVSFDFVDAPGAPAETTFQSQMTHTSRGSSNSRSSLSEKKKRYCRGCLNTISGKSVRSRDGTLSGRWHRECFMCTRCESPLVGETSDIHVHEDQPFCQSCYHVVAHTTCRMCGKGIEGSCLEATSEAGAVNPLLYHVQCLRCAECDIHLQQSYFEVDGATYCAEHAFTSLPQNTEVHKRFTQFMMI